MIHDDYRAVTGIRGYAESMLQIANRQSSCPSNSPSIKEFRSLDVYTLKMGYYLTSSAPNWTSNNLSILAVFDPETLSITQYLPCGANGDGWCTYQLDILSCRSVRNGSLSPRFLSRKSKLVLPRSAELFPRYHVLIS